MTYGAHGTEQQCQSDSSRNGMRRTVELVSKVSDTERDTEEIDGVASPGYPSTRHISGARFTVRRSGLTPTRIEPIVIARFHPGLPLRVYLREAAFWAQDWIERLEPSFTREETVYRGHIFKQREMV